MKVDTHRVTVKMDVYGDSIAEVTLRHPQMETYGVVRAYFTGDKEWDIKASTLGPIIDHFGPTQIDAMSELLTKMSEVMEDLERWARTVPAPMIYLVTQVEHSWGLTVDWPEERK